MVTFDQLMQPLIIALNNLGGSGSIDEIYEEVVELEKFDEQTLAVLHNPEKSSQTEVGYRLAWARTYLKKAGYLENSSRGVWALTDKPTHYWPLGAMPKIQADSMLLHRAGLRYLR
ncbi:winged helix-turn-helix domain-containing protein [Citrobacter freundii]